MKKILNKAQIQTVLLLTAVIFILLCGVAYTVSERRTTAANTVPVDAEKPAHELVRNSRVSANEKIMWETNIGGSGDETPVAVFMKNNEIYIFGNTNSDDLDFAGLTQGKTRGFGARLSALGRTLEFTVFDFTIAKAIPTLQGFAIAGNEGSVAGIYLLTDTLTVSVKASMPARHALEACGLYIFDNRYFLVAQSTDEVTGIKTILMHIYTSGLALEREKVFSHSYSLELLDILPFGDGYMLAAAASFQGQGYLTLARFGTISEPAYADFSLGYAYTPTAFMPLGNGFAATIERDGNCELLTIASDLSKTDVKFLTKQPNQNKKTMFYVYTGEKLIELSDDGKGIGSIDFAPKFISAFTSNEAAAFVAGIFDDGLKIALLGKQKSEIIPLTVSASSHTVLLSGATSLLTVSDSKSKRRVDRQNNAIRA